MDDKKYTGQPDDKWLDELLEKPKTRDALQEDKDAVSGHDMPILSDMELEKILREAYDEDWGAEPAAPATPAAQTPQEASKAPGQPQAVENTEEPGAVERKVRPKRKGGYGFFGLPHFVAVIIWILIAVFIGVSLGRLIWVCATDLLAFGRPDRDVTITITDSDNLDTITDKLYNSGLINYPELFKMYCQLAKVEEKDKISVGTFELNTMYDYHALVGGMSATSSYRQTTTVMIPEGYSCAQIFALLEEKGVCSVADLEKYATESDFAGYWFLEGVERGHKYCLEGFLFPDTYEFYTNATPKSVFIKFLNRFDNQFTQEMKDQLVTLNERISAMYKKRGYSQEYIKTHQLRVVDLITVASMVEKESAHSGESVDIASVIYNRLTSPSFPFLNIDATVVYALGGKTDLTAEDLRVESPYNTYTTEGLPAGPIANPGILSLKSSLNPSDTSYYYYALDPSAESREHKFFKTYQEHLDFTKGR